MIFKDLTKGEQKGIEDAVVKAQYFGEDYCEEEMNTLYYAYISKVSDYISDGPGFAGDIYTVVFGAGPEFSLIITHYVSSKFGESWDIVGYGTEMFPKKWR